MILCSSLIGSVLLAGSAGALGAGGGKGAAPIGIPRQVDAGVDQEADGVVDEFTEIPGEREYSGALIVRPLQRKDAIASGMDPGEYEFRAKSAIDLLSNYEIEEYIPETDEYIVLVPDGDKERRLAKNLLETGHFEYAQPDWKVALTICPNDAGFGQQWHHAKIGSCAAWDIAKGISDITIAICDTGERTSHVDLTGLNREGYNAVTRKWESGGGIVSDVYGHGTHVAGVAAARGNNSSGVSGMGWGLRHRPVRVAADSSGSSTISTLTAAARTAADAGDKVINVSYSGAGDPAVETTGAYIRSKGALLVWSAGNNAEYHAGNRADNVIIVGASDQNDGLAGWSGRGPRLDFVAPGVAIYSTAYGSNSSYTAWDGTSFSAPMVAGLCGLIWSRNPSLTPAQVEQILRASAVDLGAAGADDLYGYGRINAAAALAMTPPATRTVRWATMVPETSNPASTDPWTNETYAAGAETCDDCNSSTCLFATNSASGNITALTAQDFESFTLPAGQRIVKVEVEVSGRYNTDTTASIVIRAFAPSYGLDTGWRSSPSFTSGTRCAPRAGSVGDITSLSANWTAAMVNNLQLQVRRPSGLSNNTLRIVSMKLLVTTAPQ